MREASTRIIGVSIEIPPVEDCFATLGAIGGTTGAIGLTVDFKLWILSGIFPCNGPILVGASAVGVVDSLPTMPF